MALTLKACSSFRRFHYQEVAGPGGFQPTMGTLLSVAKAGGADQGADCRIVSVRATPDCATWGNPELGTEAMSRKWRGGGDTGGRFRKTPWKIWTFGFPFPKPNVVSRLDQGEPWISDLLSSKDKDVPKGSSTGAGPLPSKRERIGWVEQDHWVLMTRRWWVCTGATKRLEHSSQFSVRLNFMKLSQTATGTAKCMGL